MRKYQLLYWLYEISWLKYLQILTYMRDKKNILLGFKDIFNFQKVKTRIYLNSEIVKNSIDSDGGDQSIEKYKKSNSFQELKYFTEGCWNITSYNQENFSEINFFSKLEMHFTQRKLF